MDRYLGTLVGTKVLMYIIIIVIIGTNDSTEVHFLREKRERDRER